MITIDQLLESVDLEFEPRFVTKDPNGMVWLWETKPVPLKNGWGYSTIPSHTVGFIKLAEFENKPWQECIYEVPRKTTGKIARLTGKGLLLSKDENGKATIWAETELFNKINELVDYVNALIESNNIHEKQIDELQMKLEPEKCAVNELKGAKNETKI